MTDELRVLVKAEVAQAIENLNKLSGGIKQSEKKAQSLGDALDSISKKSLIVSGIFTGAGVAAIKFAGENERLQLSLRNMLGSAEEASAVFKEWRQLGTSPGLSVNEVNSLGKALIAMGKDVQYATSTIEMLGNITAGTGGNFSELSRVFEGVRATGKLTIRDLARMQQQGIPVVRQLARELNTSEDAVRGLAAAGRIGFADLERAFRSMSAPGGQFAGMMEELSGGVLDSFSTAVEDAKFALASFGEILLPIAADLLQTASSVLQGIAEMDESTRRFVVGMGAVIAIAGPTIFAITKIKTAMLALAANPKILAITGVVAALSAVGGALAGLGGSAERAAREYEAGLNRMIRSNQEFLQSANFEDARRRLTALTREMYEAAHATGNFEKAEAEARRLQRLNYQLRFGVIADNAQREAERALSSAQRMISILEQELNPHAYSNPYDTWLDRRLRGYASSLERFNSAMEFFNSDRVVNSANDMLRRAMAGNADWAQAVAAQNTEAMLNVLRGIDGKSPATRAEIERIQNEIAEISSGATINPLINMEPAPNPVLRKRWQEWFYEITQVDPALFGDSGSRAAELYLGGFQRAFAAESTIAEVLGSQLDAAGLLRSQKSDIRSTLVEMFAIDPSDIDQPFTLASNSVRQLVEEYRRLGNEAQIAADKMAAEDVLTRLSIEVQNLGKDQYDLALATMAAANATEYQMREAEELIKTLREAALAAGMLGMSFEQFLSGKIADGLMNIFPQLGELASTAIGNISAQLAMMTFDGLLDGLGAVGEAFATGENAAENFRHAMANMAQQMLNALPGMFLQAGLKLIAQGQWALGLGFVAAAGSSAFFGGVVRGTIANEQASANAHGNAFDSNGIIPYAHGGAFTNKIVNSPTYFRGGGKFGVMGEAGPESIMPLRRMANGDLGVAATGTGGANVTVNVINYSGADVKQEERTDAEGNTQIDVVIGQVINSHITSGKADRAMSRYGVRAQGV